MAAPVIAVFPGGGIGRDVVRCAPAAPAAPGERAGIHLNTRICQRGAAYCRFGGGARTQAFTAAAVARL